MHMGWGWGGYGVRTAEVRASTPQADACVLPARRIRGARRRAATALGSRACAGARDSCALDYGQMRAAWVSHLLTNWIGDDGWLAELDLQMRGFNYHGDVHRCTGTVTAKGGSAGEVVRSTWPPPASGTNDHPGHRQGVAAVEGDRRRGAPGSRHGSEKAWGASGLAGIGQGRRGASPTVRRVRRRHETTGPEAEHEAFRETVQQFIEQELAPNAERWEADRLVDRRRGSPRASTA